MIPAGTTITVPRDRPEVRALLMHMDWRVSVSFEATHTDVEAMEPLRGGLELIWHLAGSLLGDTEAHRALGSLLHVLGALDEFWRVRVVDAVESSARVERVAS